MDDYYYVNNLPLQFYLKIFNLLLLSIQRQFGNLWINYIL